MRARTAFPRFWPFCGAVLLAAGANAAPLAAPSVSTAPAAPSRICEAQMKRAALAYDIPVGVLYSVGLTESGKRGSLQPFAMNIDGAPFFAGGLEEATERFRSAKARGARLIDIGCMQINHRYHSARFRDLREMFDPARNVDYAARFLKELRAREGSWTLAVARYHAGPNNNPAQKRYVCAVIANMAATGFGAWTDPARRFCGV